ncbi:hypothetical protein E8E12_005945 [Didymella heteroderae]|uniref:FAD-binding domain-containing protein n=1 Tax=Didymella heteroderae TaxID=1769908 RepID=A0A9P5C238_9PLEO|nr:hypothetical protein E8E12_005945 [Didymella heteroderae]
MTTSGFQVIIVGGGIAGLTLANALEKAGIDYMLLEARDNIAPTVGASIGIFQNGGRILDQLGCYEAIEKETSPLHRGRSRDGNGKQFFTQTGILLNQARFNYPALFIDRQHALRIMYENLNDKSKVKLQKRILKVDHSEGGVVVTCNDGTKVSGDILIGCDGVHSVVRDEMWRLAHLQEQSSFDPSDQNVLFAEYQCLFGISSQTKGIVDDKANELPRYNKADAEAFARKIENFHITPELTFDGLWKNRNTYTLVPTEEAQMKRWSWGRIACVGDGVHKVTPNMGAGGNAAMETAAALANELKKMVDTAEKGQPSFETIKVRLGNYQKIRDSRMTAISKAANGLTRIHALATLKDKLFAFWVIPNAGDLPVTGGESTNRRLPLHYETRTVSLAKLGNSIESFRLANLASDMITGAVKLDYLPTPERSLHGTMPFNPSQGLGQNESKLWRAVRGLPFLGITVAAFYFMWGACLPPMIERIGEIMEKGVYNQIGEAVHVETLQSFYGVEFMDSRLRGLVACFASLQFVDLACGWQSLSFLTDAGIVYSILLIESARRASIMTLSYAPLILGYNMQFFGIGVLMALWCLVHYIQTPIENFRARDMRLTDLSYTASVLPVILLTHYLPNFIQLSSWVDPATRRAAAWIWQPFAVFTTILQFMLKKTVMPDTMQEDKLKNPNRDLPVIKYTIYSLCAISTATWWYTLYTAPFSPRTLFVPDLANAKTGDEFVRTFLQFDEIFSLGACLVWLLYLFGDLKRAGMVDASWVSIMGKGLITLVAAGPGATIGLGWWWREQVLATKWHKDAVVAVKSK